MRRLKCWVCSSWCVWKLLGVLLMLVCWLICCNRVFSLLCCLVFELSIKNCIFNFYKVSY